MKLSLIIKQMKIMKNSWILIITLINGLISMEMFIRKNFSKLNFKGNIR